MPRRVRPSFEPLEGKALLSTTSGLTFSLTTDRGVYGAGEPVRMTMVETNTSSQAVTIDLTALSNDFEVTSGSTVIWTDAPQIVPADVTTLVLQPGQSYTATATWDGVSDSGTLPAPGTYQVQSYQDPGQSAAIAIVAGRTPAQSTSLLPLAALQGGPYPGGTLVAGSPGVLYNQILDRTPDAPGLTAANQALASGTTFAQLAEDFFHSTEYETDLVGSYYWGFLGRAGTTAEINAWVSLMQKGMTQGQVAAGFLDSTEFQGLHASTSDFVQSLYQEVLGRQASSSEVAAWQNTGASRATIAGDVLISNEAVTDSIQALYATILDRPADSTGLSAAVSAVESGRLSLIDVAANLFASDEARRRDS